MSHLLSSRSLSRILVTLLLYGHLESVRADTQVLYGHSEPIPHISKIWPNQVCLVSQDGLTSTSFPWTHNPTCLDAVVPIPGGKGKEKGKETFCVYSNNLFANGRGFSLITTPEVATGFTLDSFSHEDMEDRGNLAYEARDTKDRGIGLFSTLKPRIKAGDTIMLKHPVLLMSKELADGALTDLRIKLLEIAVRQLPKETTEKFMRLAKSMGGNEIDDVMRTNSMGLALGWDGKWLGGTAVGRAALGVVPEAARVNHACRANAFYRFDDYTLTLDVFALRNIKPGEEITFSYGYSASPHSLRTESLKAHWGFTCKCPLCTSNSTTIAASDARLTEIAQMKKVLPVGHENTPRLIAMLPKVIELLDEEGIVIETPMYAEILGYAWSALGHADKAKFWAKRARQGWEIVAGRKSWEAQRTAEFEGDVQGHPSFKTWDKDPWDDSVWEDDDHEDHEDHEGHEDHEH